MRSSAALFSSLICVKLDRWLMRLWNSEPCLKVAQWSTTLRCCCESKEAFACSGGLLGSPKRWWSLIKKLAAFSWMVHHSLLQGCCPNANETHTLLNKKNKSDKLQQPVSMSVKLNAGTGKSFLSSCSAMMWVFPYKGQVMTPTYRMIKLYFWYAALQQSE